MLNIIALLIGLISLAIVIPAQIPFLGWGNWLALPLVATGAVIGALSGSGKLGRNVCLLVLVIASLRLIVGGGLL